MTHTRWITSAQREESPHETPHFKANGACDCICDECMAIVGGVVPMADYACVCKECSGQCGSTHEVG